MPTWILHPTKHAHKAPTPARFTLAIRDNRLSIVSIFWCTSVKKHHSIFISGHRRLRERSDQNLWALRDSETISGFHPQALQKRGDVISLEKVSTCKFGWVGQGMIFVTMFCMRIIVSLGFRNHSVRGRGILLTCYLVLSGYCSCLARKILAFTPESHKGFFLDTTTMNSCIPLKSRYDELARPANHSPWRVIHACVRYCSSLWAKLSMWLYSYCSSGSASWIPIRIAEAQG